MVLVRASLGSLEPQEQAQGQGQSKLAQLAALGTLVSQEQGQEQSRLEQMELAQLVRCRLAPGPGHLESEQPGVSPWRA